MSSLSVIVPRYQPGLEFETTLASVLRYRLARHQIIVVTPAEQFDDYGLADEVTFVACPERQGVAPFLKTALPQLNADVVLVLNPGVEVASQWFAPAMRELAKTDVGCVAFAVSSAAPPGIKRSLGIGLRPDGSICHVEDQRISVSGPNHFAAAFRTETLRCLLPLIDPVDDRLFGLEFALASGMSGMRCSVVDEPGISFSESLQGSLFGGYRNGLFTARLRERYSLAGRSRLSKIAGIFRKMADLATPARWSFVLGQYGARRFREEDSRYAERLTAHLRDILRDQTRPAAKIGKAA
jgi:hypothetical protein